MVLFSGSAANVNLNKVRILPSTQMDPRTLETMDGTTSLCKYGTDNDPASVEITRTKNEPLVAMGVNPSPLLKDGI